MRQRCPLISFPRRQVMNAMTWSVKGDGGGYRFGLHVIVVWWCCQSDAAIEIDGVSIVGEGHKTH